MLKLIIEAREDFDDEKQEFIKVEEDIVLELEHSLLSISKWESKYQKPFLSKIKKEPIELFDYLNFMVLTPNTDPEVFYSCSKKNLEDIQSYIESAQSATKFGDMPDRKGPDEVITSELIYYWMVTFNIPVEFEQWHINRLFALIKICNLKNAPKKKMSRMEIAERNRKLNEERKKALGTSG